ncbi:MAG: hypothetical protein OXI55_01065 [Gammaproteobacteria bacterium]|nr:hypothetical protein [Gammaproteobacteria bacterium]
MNFVSSKSWPWPVLRAGSSDYERCEFQVEVDAESQERSTEVTFVADFDLSDEAILQLIESGRASYAMLVSCPSTHFRKLIPSRTPSIEWVAENGLLGDKVEVKAYVIATETVEEFVSRNWHEDYEGRTYSLSPGSVLAMEPPDVFWIRPSEELTPESVFRTSYNEEQPPNEWRCSISGDKVTIVFSREDYDRFREARRRADVSGTKAYIMNSVYLPALAWVLAEADKGPSEDYEEFRWYSALQEALARCELRAIGDGDENDRLEDAQKILNDPFGELPFLAVEEATQQ